LPSPDIFPDDTASTMYSISLPTIDGLLNGNPDEIIATCLKGICHDCQGTGSIFLISSNATFCSFMGAAATQIYYMALLTNRFISAAEQHPDTRP